MAINLEMPKKLQAVIDMSHGAAAEMLRPISRKYDLNEHAYPVELDTLADLFEGDGLGRRDALEPGLVASQSRPRTVHFA